MAAKGSAAAMGGIGSVHPGEGTESGASIAARYAPGIELEIGEGVGTFGSATDVGGSLVNPDSSPSSSGRGPVSRPKPRNSQGSPGGLRSCGLEPVAVRTVASAAPRSRSSPAASTHRPVSVEVREEPERPPASSIPAKKMRIKPASSAGNRGSSAVRNRERDVVGPRISGRNRTVSK